MTHSFPTRGSSELIGIAVGAGQAGFGAAVVLVGYGHAKAAAAVILAPLDVDRRGTVGTHTAKAVHVRRPHRRDLRHEADQAGDIAAERRAVAAVRSEEHTSELQSLMRISYAVFCLKNKKKYP